MYPIEIESLSKHITCSLEGTLRDNEGILILLQVVC